MKRAFTLAEVLITLGIIGVVAAMTIPNLMNKINDTQYKTAYKKAYSVLYQAVNEANANSELINATDNSNTRPNDFDKNFLTIMSKFKTVKECTSGTDNADCWDSTGEKYGLNYSSGYPMAHSYAFIDVSGMAWTQYHRTSPAIFVDTNGFKKPNQWGKDRFTFSLRDKNDSSSSGLPIKVQPFTDNHGNICTDNVCGTENNYFGTSWLYN